MRTDDAFLVMTHLNMCTNHPHQRVDISGLYCTSTSRGTDIRARATNPLVAGSQRNCSSPGENGTEQLTKTWSPMMARGEAIPR